MPGRRGSGHYGGPEAAGPEARAARFVGVAVALCLGVDVDVNVDVQTRLEVDVVF